MQTFVAYIFFVETYLVFARTILLPLVYFYVILSQLKSLHHADTHLLRTPVCPVAW